VCDSWIFNHVFLLYWLSSSITSCLNSFYAQSLRIHKNNSNSMCMHIRRREWKNKQWTLLGIFRFYSIFKIRAIKITLQYSSGTLWSPSFQLTLIFLEIHFVNIRNYFNKLNEFRSHISTYFFIDTPVLHLSSLIMVIVFKRHHCLLDPEQVMLWEGK
jgi:hypothetical protein